MDYDQEEDFDSSLDFSELHAAIPDFEGRTSFISELDKSIAQSISNDELNQAVIDSSGINLDSLENYQDSLSLSRADLMRTQRVIVVPKLNAAEVKGTSNSTQHYAEPLKLERQEVSSSGWSCSNCVTSAESNCCLL
jgi:hypothetical protein